MKKTIYILSALFCFGVAIFLATKQKDFSLMINVAMFNCIMARLEELKEK